MNDLCKSSRTLIDNFYNIYKPTYQTRHVTNPQRKIKISNKHVTSLYRTIPYTNINEQTKKLDGEGPIMNIKKITILLAIGLFFATIALAQAKITATIGIIDQNGNNITQNTAVPVGTNVNITGHYENSLGYTATAVIQIYFSPNNITFVEKTNLRTTLTVKNHANVNAGPYPLTDMGYYQFRITYTEKATNTLGATYGASSEPTRCPTTSQLRTYINNVVPEPTPLIGLAIGILALSLFFMKKKNAKLKPI
jgi:hypothetical protein